MWITLLILIYINVPTDSATKYTKQNFIGLQGEINISPITFGDFNLSTFVSVIYVSGRQI